MKSLIKEIKHHKYIIIPHIPLLIANSNQSLWAKLNPTLSVAFAPLPNINLKKFRSDIKYLK